MPTKRPLTRLRDIVENGESILNYTRGMDYNAYIANPLVRDASERCLSRLSEAAVKLGPLAEKLFPNQDWRGIRDFGNVLRHEYERILDNAVWVTITVRLPPLLIELRDFLIPYPEDQENL